MGLRKFVCCLLFQELARKKNVTKGKRQSRKPESPEEKNFFAGHEKNQKSEESNQSAKGGKAVKGRESSVGSPLVLLRS